LTKCFFFRDCRIRTSIRHSVSKNGVLPTIISPNLQSGGSL
jgi:hypothetical protein